MPISFLGQEVDSLILRLLKISPQDFIASTANVDKTHYDYMHRARTGEIVFTGTPPQGWSVSDLQIKIQHAHGNQDERNKLMSALNNAISAREMGQLQSSTGYISPAYEIKGRKGTPKMAEMNEQQWEELSANIPGYYQATSASGESGAFAWTPPKMGAEPWKDYNNPADAFKQFKNIKLGTHKPLTIAVGGVPAPRYESAIQKYTRTGEALPKFQGQFGVLSLSNAPQFWEGQTYMVKGQGGDITGISPEMIRIPQYEGGPEVSLRFEDVLGTAKNILLQGKPIGNTKDWDKVSFVSQKIVEIFTRHGQTREAHILVNREIQASGLKWDLLLKGSVAGTIAPGQFGVTTLAKAGNVPQVASSVFNIKNLMATPEVIITGVIIHETQNLGRDRARVLRKYKLTEEDLEWRPESGKRLPDALFNALNQIATPHNNPDEPVYVDPKTGNMNLPALLQATREGTHAAKRTRWSPETAKMIQELDPAYHQAIANSGYNRRLTSNYKGVIAGYESVARQLMDPSAPDPRAHRFDINRPDASGITFGRRVAEAYYAKPVHSIGSIGDAISEVIHMEESARSPEERHAMGLAEDKMMESEAVIHGQTMRVPFLSARQHKFFSHGDQVRRQILESGGTQEDVQRALSVWEQNGSRLVKSNEDLFLHLARYGGTDPAKQAERDRLFDTYSRELFAMGRSHNTQRMANSLFVKQGVMGLVSSSTEVAMHEIAVGDDFLIKTFGSHLRDKPELLEELKNYIDSNEVTVMAHRFPNISKTEVLKLRLVTNRKIGVTNARALTVHPLVISHFRGDNDGDMVAAWIRDILHYDPKADNGAHFSHRDKQKGVRADTSESILAKIEAMSQYRGGLEEFLEHFKDVVNPTPGQIDELKKLVQRRDVAGINKMITTLPRERQDVIVRRAVGALKSSPFMSDKAQQGGRTFELQNNRFMAIAFNFNRRMQVSIQASGKGENMARFMSILYEIPQKRQKFSTGMTTFLDFLERYQPASGGLAKGGYDQSHGFMSKNVDDAMLRALTGIWDSAEFGHAEGRKILASILTDDEDTRKLLESRAGHSGTSVIIEAFGLNPWSTATESKSSFIQTARAQVSARWKRRLSNPTQHKPTDLPMTIEDFGYARIGDYLQSNLYDVSRKPGYLKAHVDTNLPITEQIKQFARVQFNALSESAHLMARAGKSATWIAEEIGGLDKMVASRLANIRMQQAPEENLMGFERAGWWSNYKGYDPTVYSDKVGVTASQLAHPGGWQGGSGPSRASTWGNIVHWGLKQYISQNGLDKKYVSELPMSDETLHLGGTLDLFDIDTHTIIDLKTGGSEGVEYQLAALGKLLSKSRFSGKIAPESFKYMVLSQTPELEELQQRYFSGKDMPSAGEVEAAISSMMKGDLSGLLSDRTEDVLDVMPKVEGRVKGMLRNTPSKSFARGWEKKGYTGFSGTTARNMFAELPDIMRGYFKSIDLGTRKQIGKIAREDENAQFAGVMAGRDVHGIGGMMRRGRGASIIISKEVSPAYARLTASHEAGHGVDFYSRDFTDVVDLEGYMSGDSWEARNKEAFQFRLGKRRGTETHAYSQHYERLSDLLDIEMEHNADAVKSLLEYGDGTAYPDREAVKAEFFAEITSHAIFGKHNYTEIKFNHKTVAVARDMLRAMQNISGYEDERSIPGANSISFARAGLDPYGEAPGHVTAVDEGILDMLRHGPAAISDMLEAKASRNRVTSVLPTWGESSITNEVMADPGEWSMLNEARQDPAMRKLGEQWIAEGRLHLTMPGGAPVAHSYARSYAGVADWIKNMLSNKEHMADLARDSASPEWTRGVVSAARVAKGMAALPSRVSTDEVPTQVLNKRAARVVAWAGNESPEYYESGFTARQRHLDERLSEIGGAVIPYSDIEADRIAFGQASLAAQGSSRIRALKSFSRSYAVTGGIPAMITQKTKQILRSMGFDDHTIDSMTPADAWAIRNRRTDAHESEAAWGAQAREDNPVSTADNLLAHDAQTQAAVGNEPPEWTGDSAYATHNNIPASAMPELTFAAGVRRGEILQGKPQEYNKRFMREEGEQVLRSALRGDYKYSSVSKFIGPGNALNEALTNISQFQNGVGSSQTNIEKSAQVAQGLVAQMRKSGVLTDDQSASLMQDYDSTSDYWSANKASANQAKSAGGGGRGRGKAPQEPLTREQMGIFSAALNTMVDGMTKAGDAVANYSEETVKATKVVANFGDRAGPASEGMTRIAKENVETMKMLGISSGGPGVPGGGGGGDEGGGGGGDKNSFAARGSRFANRALSGLQMMYYARIGGMIKGETSKEVVNTAELDAGYSQSLSRSGVNGGGIMSSPAGQAALSMQLGGNRMARQGAATWSSAIDYASGLGGGGLGTFASLAAPSVAAGMGVYGSLSMLPGAAPLGMALGGATALGVLGAGIGSRVAYEKANPLENAQRQADAASTAKQIYAKDMSQGAWQPLAAVTGGLNYMLQSGNMTAPTQDAVSLGTTITGLLGRQQGVMAGLSPQSSALISQYGKNTPNFLKQQGTGTGRLPGNGIVSTAEINALGPIGARDYMSSYVEGWTQNGNAVNGSAKRLGITTQQASDLFTMQNNYQGGVGGTDEVSLAKLMSSGVDIQGMTSIMAAGGGGVRGGFEAVAKAARQGLSPTQFQNAQLGAQSTMNTALQFAGKAPDIATLSNWGVENPQDAFTRNAWGSTYLQSQQMAISQGYQASGVVGSMQAALGAGQVPGGNPLGQQMQLQRFSQVQNAFMAGGNVGLGTRMGNQLQGDPRMAQIALQAAQGEGQSLSFVGNQMVAQGNAQGRGLITREQSGAQLFTTQAGFGGMNGTGSINYVQNQTMAMGKALGSAFVDEFKSSDIGKAFLASDGTGGLMGAQANLMQSQQVAAQARMGIQTEQYNVQYSAGGLTDQQRALALSQFNENWGMSVTQANTSYQQQQVGMAHQGTMTNIQHGYAQQDIQFQRAQSARGFGEQMYQMDYQMPYLTGRERRLAEHNKEYAVGSYNIDQGRQTVLAGREKQQYDLSMQWLGVEMAQQKTMHTLQMQALDLEKKHFLENYALEGKGIEYQRKWALEQLQIDQKQLKDQQDYEKITKLLGDYMTLTEAAIDKQIKLDYPGFLDSISTGLTKTAAGFNANITALGGSPVAMATPQASGSYSAATAAAAAANPSQPGAFPANFGSASGKGGTTATIVVQSVLNGKVIGQNAVQAVIGAVKGGTNGSGKQAVAK